MKPTLVTGANGHLGNNLCRLLVARGEPVRAMIRPSADPAPLAGLDLEIVRGDIMDPASTARALEGCARLYHTAAGFLMWSRDPERDIIRPSVEGTRNVLEAAARAGVEKVLYTSTSGTMGLPTRPDQPFDETHVNSEPHTHYLRGKIAAEKEDRRGRRRGRGARGHARDGQGPRRGALPPLGRERHREGALRSDGRGDRAAGAAREAAGAGAAGGGRGHGAREQAHRRPPAHRPQPGGRVRGDVRLLRQWG